MSSEKYSYINKNAIGDLAYEPFLAKTLRSVPGTVFSAFSALQLRISRSGILPSDPSAAFAGSTGSAGIREEEVRSGSGGSQSGCFGRGKCGGEGDVGGESRSWPGGE
jgi:hypothetical protein